MRAGKRRREQRHHISVRMQKRKTDFFNVWRKGSVGAPGVLRDCGESPGGCNGPSRALKGVAVQEIQHSVGARDYHNCAVAVEIEKIFYYLRGAFLGAAG